MVSRPDYSSLASALAKADAELAASESHGVLCGMICAAGKVELGAWLEQVFEELDMNNLLIQEASQQLVGLFEDTRNQLNDAVADFQLLLPDDNEPLVERAEALAIWCLGFTYGLAVGGLKKDQALPEDTAEIMHDLVEIARVSHEDDDENETDEDAYMQLCEYVRMGVLLINEELQPSHAPPQELQ